MIARFLACSGLLLFALAAYLKAANPIEYLDSESRASISAAQKSNATCGAAAPCSSYKRGYPVCTFCAGTNQVPRCEPASGMQCNEIAGTACGKLQQCSILKKHIGECNWQATMECD